MCEVSFRKLPMQEIRACVDITKLMFRKWRKTTWVFSKHMEKVLVKIQIEYASVRKRWEDRRNVPNMMGEIKVLTIYLG